MGLACGVSDARGARGVLEGVRLSVSVGADGDCGRGVRESLQKSYTEKTLPDVCVTILIKKYMSNGFKPCCRYINVLDLITQFKK